MSLPNPQVVGSSISDPNPVSLAGAEHFSLIASASGRRYRIFVAHPVDPPPPGGYPVLYFLDGNALFPTAAETVRLQTRKPKGLEAAAVVAIGYDTDQPFDVKSRFFDYTTAAPDTNMHPRSAGADGQLPERGGADDFLAFLTSEVIPAVEARLSADAGRRTLMGHSLGGFFTLHAFLRAPTTFATYAAGSPSVWWNGSELLERGREFVSAARDLSGRRLLIGIGSEEHADMIEGAASMASLLAPLRDKGLDLRHTVFDGEEHSSVIPALISRTTRFSLREREAGNL